MQRSLPPDSAGFSRFEASIAPPEVALARGDLHRDFLHAGRVEHKRA